MKAISTIALAALVAAASTPALAQQFAKAEDAIKYRQSVFTVMGTHMGRMGAMANGKAPFDAKAAAESANVLDTLAKLPFAAFGPGTDLGLNTKALPEIWKDGAKFKDAADKMAAAAAKLNAAVKASGADGLKAEFGNTGGTCKGCHDNFKAK